MLAPVQGQAVAAAAAVPPAHAVNTAHAPPEIAVNTIHAPPAIAQLPRRMTHTVGTEAGCRCALPVNEQKCYVGSMVELTQLHSSMWTVVC